MYVSRWNWNESLNCSIGQPAINLPTREHVPLHAGLGGDEGHGARQVGGVQLLEGEHLHHVLVVVACWLGERRIGWFVGLDGGGIGSKASCLLPRPDSRKRTEVLDGVQRPVRAKGHHARLALGLQPLRWDGWIEGG